MIPASRSDTPSSSSSAPQSSTSPVSAECEGHCVRLSGQEHTIQSGDNGGSFFPGVRRVFTYVAGALGGVIALVGLGHLFHSQSDTQAMGCHQQENQLAAQAQASARNYRDNPSNEVHAQLQSDLNNYKALLNKPECAGLLNQGRDWLDQADQGARVRHRGKRMVRGDLVDTRANAHKAFVAVNSTLGRCTGTVVAPDKVLTAVHCVVKDTQSCVPPEQFEPANIVLGDGSYSCTLTTPSECVQIFEKDDTQRREKLIKQIDAVLCTTDRPMVDVMPVPIMPRSSLDELCFHRSRHDERFVPNNTPFPQALYVGMGTTADSGNSASEQYAGWADVTMSGVVNGRSEYVLKSHGVSGNQDYLMRSGDSGSGLLMQDPNDGKFKLVGVNVRYTDEVSPAGSMSAEKLIGRGAEEGGEKVDQWLSSHGLMNDSAMANPYDALSDAYLPEPPTRLPDADKCPQAGGQQSGKHDKVAIPSHAMQKNSTLSVCNTGSFEMFFEIAGVLFGNNITFQQRLPSGDSAQRRMPVGFEPQKITISTNGTSTVYDSVIPKTALGNTKYNVTLSDDSLSGEGFNISNPQSTSAGRSEYSSPFRLRPERVQGKTIQTDRQPIFSREYDQVSGKGDVGSIAKPQPDFSDFDYTEYDDYQASGDDYVPEPDPFSSSTPPSTTTIEPEYDDYDLYANQNNDQDSASESSGGFNEQKYRMVGGVLLTGAALYFANKLRQKCKNPSGVQQLATIEEEDEQDCAPEAESLV